MEIKATRHNQGKPRWSLVDHKSLEPLVRVLEFGETKYGRFNWKKGLDKSEILESLYRHLIALMDGQELDEETNLHHIGHIFSNAMFYSYFNRLEKEKLDKTTFIHGFGIHTDSNGKLDLTNCVEGKVNEGK